MDDFYNHIQYVVPEKSEISFSILPETRHVSVKLLDGVADIYVNYEQNSLHLNQEFSIRFWECLYPRLKTETGCNFLVRGNHYVSSAVQHGRVENTLFAVSPSDNSYSFVLEKDIQLQIFPVISNTEQESSLTIRSSRGVPEISGFKLSRKKTYHLSPYFPVLLKSSDGKPYSIYVKGLDRKIKLSILDENHHSYMNAMNEQIFFAQRVLEKQFKYSTILVLGPKNVGKTSFCKLLVNKALENKMTPIYVDLNVKRNFSVPGALSLSEIESRINSTLDFNYNIQKFLHYGSVDLPPVSVGYYDHLVQKMGELLSVHLYYNRKKNFLSVIDTIGSRREYNTSIKLLLKSFAIDIVFYIGDLHYYVRLKNSILRNKLSAFIPKSRNTEQPCDSYEVRYYQHAIHKYFFGSTPKPSPGNVRTVALHDIAIYRISTLPNVTNSKDKKNSAYEIESIDVNLTMVNRLFGVSAGKRIQLQVITEVRYYVYFTDIDMTANMATFMVPESKNFNGGILLMGSVSRLDDSEII